MASKILDSDYLVLQRKGAKPIVEPNQPPGGPYNLYYDLEIFHFKGEDLRYTVEQYNKDSGVFVLCDGSNYMTGNLRIKYPETGNVEKGAPCRLELTGFRTGFQEFSEVRFVNRAGNTDGKTQKVAAVHPTNVNYDSFIKLNNNFCVSYDGEVYVGGRHICANDGISGETTSGGGFLSYVTDETWNAEENKIKSSMEDNVVRVRWTHGGGALKNGNGHDVLKWLNDRVSFRAHNNGDTIIAEYNADHFLSHLTPTLPKSVTNKQYVDDQDALYVPLAGTLSDAHVTGPIAFDHIGGGGCLKGAFGSPLELKQEHNGGDVKIMSIGGNNSTIDRNIHLHREMNAHNQKISNVKYPEDSVPGNDTAEDICAMPRSYIDARDARLQSQINDFVDLPAPVGMINAYVGDEDPVGWFICNGRSISELETALGMNLRQLRAVLPNNATHLPNLSGSFLAGRKWSSGDTDSAHGVPIPDPDGNRGANVGTSICQHLDQRTAEPNSWFFGINPHSHFINTSGAHSHDVWMGTGNQTWDHGGKGANVQYGLAGTSASNDWNRRYRTLAYNSNGSEMGPLTKEHSGHRHTMDNAETTALITWDDFTRPQTYTINWIIKHDNG